MRQTKGIQALSLTEVQCADIVVIFLLWLDIVSIFSLFQFFMSGLYFDYVMSITPNVSSFGGFYRVWAGNFTAVFVHVEQHFTGIWTLLRRGTDFLASIIPGGLRSSSCTVLR